jgi:hypothetical protein
MSERLEKELQGLLELVLGPAANGVGIQYM